MSMKRVDEHRGQEKLGQEKLGQEKPKGVYDPDKFIQAVHNLLIEHGVDFAILWYRNETNLAIKGWADSPTGLVVCQVVQEWLEKHMDDISADIIEKLQPKSKEQQEIDET